jgi:hypothetical protein
VLGHGAHAADAHAIGGARVRHDGGFRRHRACSESSSLI